MRILVTHLTRMREDRICVAGLTNTGEHVRPVADEQVLDRSHLLANGGLFDVGAVVELGEVEDVGVKPEVEDRLFALASARYEFHLEPDTYWKFASAHVKPGLREIFGPDLQPVGGTMIVPVAKGEASLGAFAPKSGPELFLDDRGRVRARLNHSGSSLRLPVTDIRVYDQRLNPREDVMEWLNRECRQGCVLTVGLSRPFKGASRPIEEHWLQINNLHPASDPLWMNAPGSTVNSQEKGLVDPAATTRLRVVK